MFKDFDQFGKILTGLKKDENLKGFHKELLIIISIIDLQIAFDIVDHETISFKFLFNEVLRKDQLLGFNSHTEHFGLELTTFPIDQKFHLAIFKDPFLVYFRNNIPYVV